MNYISQSWNSGENNMNKIPKIIHYCWFGKHPLSDLAIKCIESWRKYCPDYEIKRWDESNFDFEDNIYAKEAWDSKKWAFVADCARLSALYDFGGIYMDTDVELLKNLDKFLKHQAFFGFENNERISTATIGSYKANPYFKLLLHYYDNRKFILPDKTFDVTTNVTTITKSLVENYGVECNNLYQELKDGLVIYPRDWFSPKDFETTKISLTKNSVAIHHFNASWWTDEERLTFNLQQH